MHCVSNKKRSQSDTKEAAERAAPREIYCLRSSWPTGTKPRLERLQAAAAAAAHQDGIFWLPEDDFETAIDGETGAAATL